MRLTGTLFYTHNNPYQFTLLLRLKKASYKLYRLFIKLSGTNQTLINDVTTDCLKVIARDGNCPHIIISGLTGIGKTTRIPCLAHALLGESYKDAVLELNASDKRGIDIVRNKIKTFANIKVSLPTGRHKVIILDEADSMTPGAQQALRRTMEIHSNSTSQCAILRYLELSDQLAEKVRYFDDSLSAPIFSFEGDMRQAINNLQSNHSGFGFKSSENVFKKILLACEKGNISNCLYWLDQLWSQGYSPLDIVTMFMKVVKTMDKMAEYLKLEFIKEIGFTHMQILEGVSTLTQSRGLMLRLCKLKIDPKSFNV
ncbi:replication factor C subunit 4 [Phakopsora pachyrhizi]|uniref:Replication factor C subunit 4 n=1 Tax=Phakopsora pachyrhizi TaxID=170000 RepID=A0AAV0AQJ6_PHAPC|nr:replication factor C subunit 4 [Phakopsora pachyrhizi]